MDLSRQQPQVFQQHSGEVFAISFRPGEGKMHAIVPPTGNQRLQEHGFKWIGRDDMPATWTRQGTHIANLGWKPKVNEMKRNTVPVHCGMFLEKRKLTFYRYEKADCGDGHWQSSGVVCENLPIEIVPCVFMFSFTGYTQVKFTGFRRAPPGVSPHCGEITPGLSSSIP